MKEAFLFTKTDDSAVNCNLCSHRCLIMLTQIAQYIYNVDPNIPWHISRFFPRFQFLDYEATHIHSLEMAAEIGRKNGLNHVYLGNV